MKNLIILVFVFMISTLAAGRQKMEKPLYLDSSQPTDVRIDDLLSRMTLEEKVGQLNMPCVYEGGLGNSTEEKMIGVKKFAEGTQLNDLGPGGGFFTLPNTILHNGTTQQVEFHNKLQKIAVEKKYLVIFN